MNAKPVKSRFAEMGARFEVNSWQSDSYAIEIKRNRCGQFVELRMLDRVVALNTETKSPSMPRMAFSGLSQTQ